MADRMLYRLALLVLALGALGWGGVLMVGPLKQSGRHLMAQVSQSTQGRIRNPQAYVRWCAQDWGCSLQIVPHLWRGMPISVQRQGAGMLGLGVLGLFYLALTRETSKTIERRRFEPTHKVR